MKTIKTTDKIAISKVGVSVTESVFLDVDSNGVLGISTSTGNNGGILVEGASSVSTFQGSVVVSGTVAIPMLGSDLDVNGYDIISSSNGNIELNPHGTGEIVLNGPVVLGGDLDIGNFNVVSTAGADIEIDPDGAGKILLSATTQLGGNLDVVNYNIVSTAGADIELDPDGAGKILLSAETKLSGNLDLNGNNITTTVVNGGISIQPNGTGAITLDAVTWPVGAGTSTYVLKTDGVSATSWGQATVLELSDTPNSYATYGSKFVKVNSGANAVEFVDDQDLIDATNNSFGAAAITVGDAAYMLSSSEAKAGKILVLGSKTADTYYVMTATIVNAGTGYTVGDILTLVGGTSATVGKILVDTVGGGGDITGILVETTVVGDEGDYSVVPVNPVSVTGGTGASATFTIRWDKRRTEVVADVLDLPISFNVFCLYQNGNVIFRSSTQLYRQGVYTSLSQYKSMYANAALFGDDGIREMTPESGSNNDSIAIDFLADIDYPISFYDAICYHADITDSTVVLTAPRSVEVPLSPYSPVQPSFQFVKNSTAQTITYKASGGTGVAIAPSDTRAIYYDGLDFFKLPIFIQDDTTPQLGGNLDINGFDIVSTSNGDIAINPDGTGKILLEAETKLSGSLDLNGNNITTTVVNGGISIQPNGSGVITLDAVTWPTDDGSAANQVLRTDNAGASSWVTLNLDYLDDVAITSAAEGDMLIRNATQWVDAVYTKIYEATTTTTNTATPAIIKAIAVPSNKAMTFIINGHGFDSTNDYVYSAHVHGCVRNFAGTTSIVGTVTDTHTHIAGAPAAAWDITVAANDTTDELEISVTGSATETVNWFITISVTFG